mgnify:CR=1 FL=1
MKEHTARGAIMIMLIKGALLVASLEEEIVRERGKMVCLESKIPHSLEALGECVVRLVLSKHDRVPSFFRSVK